MQIKRLLKKLASIKFVVWLIALHFFNTGKLNSEYFFYFTVLFVCGRELSKLNYSYYRNTIGGMKDLDGE